MSYILKIWEPAAGEPSLPDLRAAVAAVVELQDRRTSPSRGFGAFLEALTVRFPDITSPEAEELPETELAWTDGPLMPGQSAVMVLGLRSENVDRVRPFVIERAMEAGLAVLDEQAAEAYLPGVGRLGGPIALAANRHTDQPLDTAGVGAAVADALEPLLAAIAFKRAKSKPTFKRTFPGGRQLVEVILDDHGTAGIQFSILCTFYLDRVTELRIQVSLRHLHPSAARDLHVTALRQVDWLTESASFVVPRTRKYVARTREELAQVLSHLVTRWDERVQPILQQFTTAEGADHLLNTQPLTASPFFDRWLGVDINVLVAYLARNPRVQEIGTTILAQELETPQRERVNACMDHVRVHPHP